MFCQFWSRLSFMYIVEYTNIKTNWRRIFSTKKLRGGRPSPAASSAHLPAVKFSSSLPPMFSWYLCFFLLSSGYHLLMLRLNPWNHEVENSLSIRITNFRVCVVNLLCQTFPKPLLAAEEAPRLWTRLAGWVVGSFHLLVYLVPQEKSSWLN